MVSYDISGCNPIRIQPQIHLAPQSQRNPLQFHKHPKFHKSHFPLNKKNVQIIHVNI